MNNLSISVIIVVENGERYLIGAIESVLAQTYQPNEIIIVDGRSTDNTEMIAKSYQQVRYMRQVGRGLADARNTGIDSAQGELIAFLDHDDLWIPKKLNTQISYFIKNPEIQYTNARLKLFLEPGCSLRIGFPKDLFEKEQLGRTPGTLVARKSLFNLIGKFNSRFNIGCDVEWFVRAKDYNIPMSFISDVLLYKRVHDTNISGNVQVNKQELLTIIKQSLEHKRHQKAQSTRVK